MKLALAMCAPPPSRLAYMLALPFTVPSAATATTCDRAARRSSGRAPRARPSRVGGKGLAGGDDTAKEPPDRGPVVACCLPDQHVGIGGCAWDTLFLPALLDDQADVQSSCPMTGTAVRLTVARGRVLAAHPQDVIAQGSSRHG